MMFGYGYVEWFMLFIFIWFTHYALEHTKYLFDRRRKMLEKAMTEAERKEARRHVDELIEKHDKLNPEVQSSDKVLN